MMKKLLALLLAIQLSTMSMVHAAFEDVGAGARAPGMADVFVGVADGADTASYNPAGLAQLKNDELSMQYGQLLRGSSDGSNLGTTYLAAVHRLRKGALGTIGFTYNNFRAQSLFSERTLMLSYGWKLKVLPFGLNGIWSMGANLKQFHHQYEPDRFTENALNDAGAGSNAVDPIFAKNGYAKDAYSIDWGALYQFGPSHRASAGLSLSNINRPDISLNNDGDVAPFIGKLGLGYRLPWGLISGELRRTTRLTGITDTDMALGLERDFKTQNNGGLTVRGGYAKGSRNYKAMTAGMSYSFSRTRIDYAFNFPVTELQNSQGSHRLGLSILLGADKDSAGSNSISETTDLLIQFAHNATAAHAVLHRGIVDLDPSNAHQALVLQLMVNKYPMDQYSTRFHNDLRRIETETTAKLMEWPEVKNNFAQIFPADDQSNIENTLDVFAKGDSDYTLARLALLSAGSKSMTITKLLTLTAHAELAAQAYRVKKLDSCIDHVRQIMDILPQDAMVVDAYRKLLLMRTQQKKQDAGEVSANEAKENVSHDNDLPDAPIALTEPTPTNQLPSKTVMSEMDAVLRGYGSQMGYYFSRKAEGASMEEKRVLLQQIRTLYGTKGIDLALLDRELAQVKETPKVIEQPATPKVVATPTTAPSPSPKIVATPTPVTSPEVIYVAPKTKLAPTPLPAAERRQVVAKYKIVIKSAIPIIASSPELDWALKYYKSAVDRGISDPERIEILESIVIRFGEVGAKQVSKELERIRKRLE